MQLIEFVEDSNRARGYPASIQLAQWLCNAAIRTRIVRHDALEHEPKLGNTRIFVLALHDFKC